jgi:hypothetical protein
VFCWCELGQVWVESDLIPSDRVHGTADDTKERVDPPSSVSAGSSDTIETCGEISSSRKGSASCAIAYRVGMCSIAGARWGMKAKQRDGALMGDVHCAGAG